MSFVGDGSTYEIQQETLRRILSHHENQMPSRPPETKFYDNNENTTLWRDVSRLYEDFLGSDSEQWPEREERFVTVLNDVHVRLRETPRRVRID